MLLVKTTKTENVFWPHVLWLDHNHMLSYLEHFQEVLKAEGALKFFTNGTAPYISGFVFDKWLPHVIPTHKMLPHKEINLLTKITTYFSVKTKIKDLTTVWIDFYKRCCSFNWSERIDNLAQGDSCQFFGDTHFPDDFYVCNI